jgi:hypothetical protein
MGDLNPQTRGCQLGFNPGVNGIAACHCNAQTVESHVSSEARTIKAIMGNDVPMPKHHIGN